VTRLVNVAWPDGDYVLDGNGSKSVYGRTYEPVVKYGFRQAVHAVIRSPPLEELPTSSRLLDMSFEMINAPGRVAMEEMLELIAPDVETRLRE